MYLIHVHETNWIDRNVIQVHHLFERLAARGHICEVIDYDMLWSTRPGWKIWQPRQVFDNVYKVIPGVSIKVSRPAIVQVPLICHLTWAIGSIYEVINKIRLKKPDAILSCSLTNSYLLALLCKLLKIPFIYMIYEPYYSMVPIKLLRPIAKIVEKLASRASRRIFVFTPQMKQYVQRMGVNPMNIEVFQSGVGQEIFDVSESGINCRSQLGIEKNDWVIFFMGWLYEFSGLRQIFQEINKDPCILDGSRLLIVGDGDIYSELKGVVRDNNLHSKIIMTGKKPYQDIPALLGTSDVCLMTALENDTTRDIVPMKAYEYLAAGKPVISTNLPGMLAEFGMNSGIIYTDTPIEALYRAIGLSKNIDLVHNLAIEGRRFAEVNYNWGKTTEIFEDKIFSLINID